MKRTFSLSAMMAFFLFQATHFEKIAEANIDKNFSMNRKAVQREFIQSYIEDAAAIENLEPALLAAIIHVESNYNHKAISRVGARGLMQIMPGTAEDIGETRALDHRKPRFNIRAGAKYLREMINTFSGDLRLAIAAYNAGPMAVKKYRGIPPYAETREYVKKVFRQLSVERKKLLSAYSSSSK